MKSIPKHSKDLLLFCGLDLSRGLKDGFGEVLRQETLAGAYWLRRRMERNGASSDHSRADVIAWMRHDVLYGWLRSAVSWAAVLAERGEG